MVQPLAVSGVAVSETRYGYGSFFRPARLNQRNWTSFNNSLKLTLELIRTNIVDCN